MATALYTHDSAGQHVTPPGHPEQVARWQAIMSALGDEDFAALDRREAPVCDDADILRCHPQSHIDAIASAIPEDGQVALDADTHVSPDSLEAARRAVGANCAAVDAVLSGDVANAFVAMRPPGHHAERETAMGFCLFGSAAIAAKRALDHRGLSRVAIVDFDVHHGNGTQDLLWDEARCFFASSHQMPLYPGSGAAGEKGAHGQILNTPLRPGSGWQEMSRAYENQIFPALEAFKPELLIISAGFDAHAADPLAQLEWSVEDFIWVTRKLCDIADRHCAGRVVSTLEGGYDLQALAASAAAHVRVLMERGS